MSTPALARVQACVAGKSGTGISGYKNIKKAGWQRKTKLFFSHMRECRCRVSCGRHRERQSEGTGTPARWRTCARWRADLCLRGGEGVPPEGCPEKVGGAGVRGAGGAPARVCGGGPGGAARQGFAPPEVLFVGREGSFRAKSCLYPKRCVNFARILFICMKNG